MRASAELQRWDVGVLECTRNWCMQIRDYMQGPGMCTSYPGPPPTCSNIPPPTCSKNMLYGWLLKSRSLYGYPKYWVP